MVKRRSAGEPVAYITGRRAFWNIDLHVGPGVLVPRPDSEVLIASAIEHFEGSDGPAADSRPRHRAGHAAARRARRLAERDGAWHRRVAPGLVLCVGQCAAARLRGPAQVQARAIGPKGSTSSSTLSCATRPMSPKARSSARALREYEPDEALFAGKRASMPIASWRRSCRGCSTAAASRRWRSGTIRRTAVTALLARDGLQAQGRQDLAERPRAVCY